MQIDLNGPDRILLDRFIESVLLRFADGKYNLLEARDALTAAFIQAADGDPTFLDHLRGVIEAGEDT